MVLDVGAIRVRGEAPEHSSLCFTAGRKAALTKYRLHNCPVKAVLGAVWKLCAVLPGGKHLLEINI